MARILAFKESVLVTFRCQPSAGFEQWPHKAALDTIPEHSSKEEKKSKLLLSTITKV
jgi:hypothetical protein